MREVLAEKTQATVVVTALTSERRHAGCRSAGYYYDDCRCTECHYAEYRHS